MGPAGRTWPFTGSSAPLCCSRCFLKCRQWWMASPPPLNSTVFPPVLDLWGAGLWPYIVPALALSPVQSVFPESVPDWQWMGVIPPRSALFVSPEHPKCERGWQEQLCAVHPSWMNLISCLSSRQSAREEHMFQPSYWCWKPDVRMLADFSLSRSCFLLFSSRASLEPSLRK